MCINLKLNKLRAFRCLFQLHIETRNHPKPYAALRVTAFNNELINMNFDQEMFDTIMTNGENSDRLR